MPNPLERSIAAANRTAAEYRRVFGQLGNSAHPRGAILTAYRNARRGLKSAYGEINRLAATQEVMLGLRRDVERGVDDALLDGRDIGLESAKKQLDYYNTPPRIVSGGVVAAKHNAELTAALAMVDQQTAAVNAILTAPNPDLSLLIGDDTRLGVVQPAPIIKDVTSRVVKMGSFAWSLLIAASDPRNRFRKQAIAALDERTTECCLRVHGQIQPLDEPFKLTGTPRYADEIQEPPFHWYCRTAFALYAAEYDDGLTRGMRKSANVIIKEREAGGTGERHPADAFA